MTKNPMLTLRNTLSALLDGAAFDYEAGETRKLVRQGQKVLAETAPDTAHQRAVGVFRYDADAKGYVEVDEALALDIHGNLRPGFEYLYRQPKELAQAA